MSYDPQKVTDCYVTMLNHLREAVIESANLDKLVGSEGMCNASAAVTLFFEVMHNRDKWHTLPELVQHLSTICPEYIVPQIEN